MKPNISAASGEKGWMFSRYTVMMGNSFSCTPNDYATLPSSHEDCALFFVKYPEKGKVKRRLAVRLGEEVTIALYRNFVLDSLATLNRSHVFFWVCYHPRRYQKKFSQWLGEHYCYAPQRGRNLGQRMKNSFIDAFKNGFQHVILLGSDIPDMPDAFLTEAFQVLREKDTVIGPSLDGGYYLIGFNHASFLPEVFDLKQWSTTTVFQDTLSELNKKGLRIHALPRWNDIDTCADLKDLMVRNKGRGSRYSHTITYLSKNGTLLK